MDFGGFIDIEAQSSVGRSYGYFLGRRASPFIRIVSVWVLYWVGLFFSSSWAYKEEEGRQGKGITDRRRMMHLSFVFSGVLEMTVLLLVPFGIEKQ